MYKRQVMACPGGCIGGGGQPIKSTNDVKIMRMDAIYSIDKSMKIRKSHQNPEVIRLYKEYLAHPLSEKAHRLLHTRYNRIKKEYEFAYLNDEPVYSL